VSTQLLGSSLSRGIAGNFELETGSIWSASRKREKIGSYIGIAIGLVRLIPTILFLVPILVPMLILGQVIESIRKILGVEDKEPNGSA
jgi:hypothetical protein